MVAEQIGKSSIKQTRSGIRLEVVDNAHDRWPAVARWIEQCGESPRLLDENGWLSARQIVVAAFDGEKVIGHLGFRVDPKRAGGKIILDAWIDSVSVAKPETEQFLFDRAQAHARLLGCRDLRRD